METTSSAWVSNASGSTFTLTTAPKLAGSQEFLQTVRNHNFLVKATAAPDASSENGMAERPHQTLKEKVRCV